VNYDLELLVQEREKLLEKLDELAAADLDAAHLNDKRVFAYRRARRHILGKLEQINQLVWDFTEGYRQEFDA
jgi:predicted AAA+ superfamily ATPase